MHLKCRLASLLTCFFQLKNMIKNSFMNFKSPRSTPTACVPPSTNDSVGTKVKKRRRQANKPKNGSRERNQVCPWISTPVNEERHTAIRELEARGRVLVFVQHQTPQRSCLPPPPINFFQHCLFVFRLFVALKHSNCISQMFRSLEVCIWRQVSARKTENRRWKMKRRRRRTSHRRRKNAKIYR